MWWIILGGIYLILVLLGAIWERRKERQARVQRRPLTFQQKLAILQILRELRREQEEELRRFREFYLREPKKVDWKKEGF